jgi:DNA-binding beta-propeller fold protein YncE
MRRAAILALALSCIPALAPPAMAQTWLAESAQALPSTDTGWGAITFDEATGRLFVARRADGLLVWDTKTRQSVTVENSAGANGVVLVPEFNRAYAAMTDGTLLAFDATTLKPIERLDLGAGDLDQAVYEPTQKRIHVITGARAEKVMWITLDAANGQVLSRTEFNSKRMDPPATDGHGAIFAPMRDRAQLQQLDARDLSVQKTWKLGECTQPAAAVWDAAAERVLIACRGEKPVFVALSPAAGVVATVPIGQGAGGLVFDAARRLVVTANGDGTFSVIRQDKPDAYALVETIATRPMARVLQLDARTGRLMTVTASFTDPAPAADGKSAAVFYHPDSFSVLTYHAK